ncbi:MAG: hypothetical protein WCW53_13285 [Syntrophales bacterium]
MKKMCLVFAAATIFAGICMHAEESKNLVANGNAASGSDNWQCGNADATHSLQIVGGGPDGANCFEVTGHTWVSSTENIPVDPNCEYRLTGWFRSGNDMANQVCVGLLLFDESFHPIVSTSVDVLEKSETVLTAEAQIGERVIKLKDASAWEALFENKQLTIAFEVDDSGEYRDLPNQYCYKINDLLKKDGLWEATLAKPIPANFSAGTKVRAHVTSEHYVYAFEMKQCIGDWTEYSGMIKPMIKFGPSTKAFWPGTKYARVLILANWGQNHGEILQFGNISLEKQ